MEFVNKYSDVFLATAVVLVIGLMILPLPTLLIDVLLTLNVAFGITLLLIVLYVSNSLNLTSFPSLLLIATLFRLGLNVSTTRLILLQGDAGQMIKSFGGFVVQGNMIVGAIVFIILTLINFIVISKGSERVAEVAARFTLDAMPGKQMAIDADLRAGAFDMEEARRRRRMLSRESQLFGAMDGSMKFVKGDAIAGIIITCINVIGGVAIGILMNNMAPLDALTHFGLLTIGDGLLSQIPALIISSSAGLMVTRVEPESPGSHLGKDIGRQLLAYPKALVIVALVLGVLGIVPGLPVIPFWSIALVLTVIAIRLIKSNSQANEEGSETPENSERSETDHALEFALPIPVLVILDASYADSLSIDSPDCGFVQEEIPRLRQRIYSEIGVRIPGIRVRKSTELPSGCNVEIHIMDLPVFQGNLSVSGGFVPMIDDRFKQLASKTEEVESGYPFSGTLISEESIQRVSDAGYSVYFKSSLLALVLHRVITRNAHELLGLQETKWMCDELEVVCPDSINELVPQRMSYARLCDVLRRLVQEEVSIRDFKRIIETLAEYADLEPDNIALTDTVRARLGRQICHKRSENGTLSLLVISSEIEEMFRESIELSGSERILAMSPDLIDRIIQSFSCQMDKIQALNSAAILTVEHSIRYVLWRFLSQQFPNISVLAAQELPPGLSVQAVGSIDLING